MQRYAETVLKTGIIMTHILQICPCLLIRSSTTTVISQIGPILGRSSPVTVLLQAMQVIRHAPTNLYHPIYLQASCPISTPTSTPSSLRSRTMWIVCAASPRSMLIRPCIQWTIPPRPASTSRSNVVCQIVKSQGRSRYVLGHLQSFSTQRKY